MYFSALVLIVVLLLVVALAAMNWPVFVAPTAMWLGIAEFQVPLGLLLLAVMGLVCGLFLVIILLQQAGVILETRRTSKELHAQRELADKAEASRFTELRTFIEAEMKRLQQHGDEQTRTLAAYVGEVEDKLDRLLPPPPRP
jgi:hypothetical protein